MLSLNREAYDHYGLALGLYRHGQRRWKFLEGSFSRKKLANGQMYWRISHRCKIIIVNNNNMSLPHPFVYKDYSPFSSTHCILVGVFIYYFWIGSNFSSQKFNSNQSRFFYFIKNKFRQLNNKGPNYQNKMAICFEN